MSSVLALRFWRRENAHAACLALAFLIAAIYAAIALKLAYSEEYIVQDDARQHVFWMERFVDPEAFPGDLIADYFQSLAPFGYSALYKAVASLGLHPVDFSKILPAVLALVATFYVFRLTLILYPSLVAALITTIMFNQSLWLRPNIVSGTPRAFAAVLLIIFVYYLVRRSLGGSATLIGLQGMFYPPVTLISLGTAGLNMFNFRRLVPQLSRLRRDYTIAGACFAVAVVVLLPYLLKTSDFGPAVRVEEARRMPEFGPEGRLPFFVERSKKYWISGKQTGLLRRADDNNPLMYLALLLPFLWRGRAHSTAGEGWGVVGKLLAASVILWAAAHALLFHLYIPARYMEHTWSIVLNLSGGISAALIIERLMRARSRYRWIGTAAVFGILLLHPVYKWGKDDFPDASFVAGKNAELYEFFAAKPKNILIASLSGEADTLPVFSRRSMLVSREHGISYQPGYYRKFSQRARDLIRAQYTPDAEELRIFIEKYGVDYLLLDRGAFTPEYVRGNKWLMQYQPEASKAIRALDEKPAITRFFDSCLAHETQASIVLDASCIARQTM